VHVLLKYRQKSPRHTFMFTLYITVVSRARLTHNSLTTHAWNHHHHHHHHHHHVACPVSDVAVPTSLLHACMKCSHESRLSHRTVYWAKDSSTGTYFYLPRLLLHDFQSVSLSDGSHEYSSLDDIVRRSAHDWALAVRHCIILDWKSLGLWDLTGQLCVWRQR